MTSGGVSNIRRRIRLGEYPLDKAIQKQDIAAWAARNEIVAQRAAGSSSAADDALLPVGRRPFTPGVQGRTVGHGP
jgi:hypothetical protein